MGVSSARHSTARAPWPTWGSITDGFEVFGGALGEPRRSQRGGGDHDRVELGRLVEAGRDVAAQLGEGEVGAQRGELRAAPHRAGRHPSTGRERREGRADERVARVGAFGHRREHEAVGSPTPGGPWPSAPRGRRGRRGRPAAPPSRRRRCRRSRGSGTSVRASPVVVTITSSTSSPRSAATRSACHRASALPRVATRSVRGISRRRRGRAREGRTARRARRRRARRGRCRRRPSPGRSARAAAC